MEMVVQADWNCAECDYKNRAECNHCTVCGCGPVASPVASPGDPQSAAGSSAQLAWLVDSSDSDGAEEQAKPTVGETEARPGSEGDEPSEPAASRAAPCSMTAPQRLKRKRDSAGGQLELSCAQKAACLAKLDRAEDRRLQEMLFELGFNFELLPHQFVAVRATAGVSMTFPGKKGNRGDPLEIMASAEPTQTRGVLLADVMGLGKTVEAIGGALLRIGIARAQRKPALPTLIVAPNDAVLAQWRTHLLQAGTSPSAILIFTSKASREARRWSLGGAPSVLSTAWVLMTRYTLQVEARQALEGASTQHATSVLFPQLTGPLGSALHQTYKASHGSAPYQHKMPGETDADIVSRLIRTAVCTGAAGLGRVQVFRTLIIDEAHFLKNQAAFWGIGAMLLAAQSEYSVPLTGTPYNNSIADMAAIQSFMDVRHPAAQVGWWEQALSALSSSDAAQQVSAWREKYMVRRGKEVLVGTFGQLEPKEFVGGELDVKREIQFYAIYEDSFLKILDQFNMLSGDDSLMARQERNRLFMQMMSCLQCMRLSLIHPLAPNGREFTIPFSPTRKGLLKSLEEKKKCRICEYERVGGHAPPEGVFSQYFEQFTEAFPQEKLKPKHICFSGNVRTSLSLEDVDEDKDGDEDHKAEGKAEGRSLGALCKLQDCGNIICRGSCGHWAHDVCIKEKIGLATMRAAFVVAAKLRDDAQSCATGPHVRFLVELVDRANDLVQQLTPHLSTISAMKQQLSSSGKGELDQGDLEKAYDGLVFGLREATKLRTSLAEADLVAEANLFDAKETCPRCEDFANRLSLEGKSFCEHVTLPINPDQPGFKVSTKIQEAIEWVENLPQNDKGIILSFFKSGLDLLEGALTSSGIDCARFDGDVTPSNRAQELERFKTQTDCRVLLATVASGGTGLNITEANHILFLDRWFNPFVHAQAMDRCHRIGQKKTVKVRFLDGNMTGDQVMRWLNDMKQQNAKVVLADGTELGVAQSSAALTYNELSGYIGNLVRYVRSKRGELLPEAPIPPAPNPHATPNPHAAPNPHGKQVGPAQPSEAFADRMRRLKTESEAYFASRKRQATVTTTKEEMAPRLVQMDSEANPVVVNWLVEMGYAQVAATEACLATRNTGVPAAVEWLSHNTANQHEAIIIDDEEPSHLQPSDAASGRQKQIELAMAKSAAADAEAEALAAEAAAKAAKAKAAQARYALATLQAEAL